MVKEILNNKMGVIESYTRDFKTVYRVKIKMFYQKRPQRVTSEIKTIEEAKIILWQDSDIQDYSMKYYQWGNEPKANVSGWIDLLNGDWFSVGHLPSECIVKNEDWTKESPYP